MTIICFKDGIMAADTNAATGRIMVGRVKKIVRRTSDGALIAAAGITSQTARFREWALAGADGAFDVHDAKDEFGGVIVLPNGKIFHYEHHGDPYTMNESIVSEGAGWELALGAMFAGASAEEAVRICLKYHINCGGDVQIEKLHP